MFLLLLLSVAFCGVLGQGQHDYNQGGQNQRNYAPAPQYYTTPAPRNYHPPAPVHYVDIGQQLQGDYKFGYDTGKGPLGQSFREETRLPDGSVKGAYGYVDDSGKQRIIKYSAGKSGFFAEGDLGAEGSPTSYPGNPPQPVRNPYPAQAAPAQQHHRPAPQQYNPPQQQYNPPQQQYNPPQQQYNPPPQQYRQQQRYDTGEYDPKLYEDLSDKGPPFIDVALLTYNIGTARKS